jgi:hypothetical protein
MPRFKKGSKGAKEYMKKIREKRVPTKNDYEYKDFQEFYTKAKKDFIVYYKKDNRTDEEPEITKKIERELKEKAMIEALNYLLIK